MTRAIAGAIAGAFGGARYHDLQNAGSTLSSAPIPRFPKHQFHDFQRTNSTIARAIAGAFASAFAGAFAGAIAGHGTTIFRVLKVS